MDKEDCWTLVVVRALVTLDMSHRFKEVIGIDPNLEMIKTAKHQRELRKCDHVHLRAEEIDSTFGTFQVVTCVSSFHWMERREVLEKVFSMIQSGGGIAIWGMGSFWAQREKWQIALIELIKMYLGPERHGETLIKQHPSHQEIVQEAGFKRVETRPFPIVLNWDIEQIMGYLYSTSFAAKSLFKNKFYVFDQEARQLLQAMNPNSSFEDHVTINVIVGWK
jgi:2-polyprenyl-3-methyl-5-hydroxy-6-metoxy-1,4-benzoquinol methylase